MREFAKIEDAIPTPFLAGVLRAVENPNIDTESRLRGVIDKAIRKGNIAEIEEAYLALVEYLEKQVDIEGVIDLLGEMQLTFESLKCQEKATHYVRIRTGLICEQEGIENPTFADLLFAEERRAKKNRERKMERYKKILDGKIEATDKDEIIAAHHFMVLDYMYFRNDYKSALEHALECQRLAKIWRQSDEFDELVEVVRNQLLNNT